MMGWWDGKRKVEIKRSDGWQMAKWRDGGGRDENDETRTDEEEHHRKKPKSGPRWE
jgi:hypothetical protein